MTHYFYTRIALDTAAINKTLPVRTAAQHEAACRMWLRHSRKFYENQTIDRPFRVVLGYSDKWKSILDSFDWPDYVTFTTGDICDWLRENVSVCKPTTVSRVDADDSYSLDLFEMLDTVMPPKSERTMMLYHWVKQYDMVNGRVGKPIRHLCPQFATVYFPQFPVTNPRQTARHIPGNPFYGVVGNHGRYIDQPYIEPNGCYALLRLAGQNAINRWGTIGHGIEKPVIDTSADPRFIL